MRWTTPDKVIGTVIDHHAIAFLHQNVLASWVLAAERAPVQGQRLRTL